MLHKTDTDGDAYESADGDNSYFWRIVENVSPIVDEVPHPVESDFGHGRGLSSAAISIHNAWPETVDNASVFLYLNQDWAQDYPEFSAFIKNWYQSACAIVYKNGSTSKIVGSGTLVEKTHIATARHNFNDIHPNHLFVRFFRYKVTNTLNPRYLLVKERYLDIPVISKIIANHGVDAGYLKIPSLNDIGVFNRYAKIIPADFNPFESSLPSGAYAMFHFSAGKPQVSVGKIDMPSFGEALHDDTFIQAGPGASGAGLIWKRFDTVSAVGISIYRLMNEGNIQRRIIGFSQFKTIGYVDRISAPYYFNPNFTMIPVSAFNEPGYEFLRYRLEVYKGRRVEHPARDEYAVKDHHSNHHIVPINDLFYLWDYFHTLDSQSEIEVRNIVRAAVQQERWNLQTKLQKQINEFYPHERDHQLSIGNAQISEKLESFAKKKYKAVYEEKVFEKYYAFHFIFRSLTPAFQEDNVNFFVWPLWNLFQGWNKSYRTDDPADGPVDFSEKMRPASFSHALWSCLKDDDEGLYRRIQQLKATTTLNSANKTTMYGCLTVLAKEWEKRSHADRKIHRYRDSEWDLMGQKNGHDVYQVKPSY